MMTSNPVWRWDRAVTLSALVANLMIWVGAATGQPPIAPPAVVVVPTALLHYQYCQTRTQQPLDDCLLERFTTSALFDSSTGRVYVSQRFKTADAADRASLIVQLARYAGESALVAMGDTIKSGRHERIVDCGQRFEDASRELARAYLVANGVMLEELPSLEVEDGMAPWSCRSAELARHAGPAVEPGS